ncbi:hypothetical protein [Streptomyces sp. NRRL F-2890]|uniref:hypothetical protein n=1 Tax=Streptomyces sp. NRRL F-2890 TaxID=1463845 RepID=UPI0004C48659|nr:hypothetical protein [Streptomyces sp. NRRL F-2890]
MNDPLQNIFNGAAGAVKTGSGPQVVFTILQDGLLGTKRDPRFIGQDYLRWLARRFSTPAGWGVAHRLLTEHGIVLLSAPEGAGRKSAAMMLLRPHHRSRRTIIELADTPDGPGVPVLAPDTVEPGDHLLLDLSRSDSASLAAIQRRLASYHAAIRDLDARLVVILPANPEFTPSELRPFHASLNRPDSINLLQRHLRADGLVLGRKDFQYPPLTAWLNEAPARALAELATLILSARHETPAESFTTWCDHALSALRPWTRDVTSRITRHRLAWQRAMLLSAAMLTGAPGEAVLTSTRILLGVMRQPDGEDIPVLERDDLSQMLTSIDAETDGEGRVHFPRLAYDQAVRRHFWTNRPALRHGFREWADRLCKEVPLAPDERAAFVARFAEQCLRTGRPQDLEELASSWTEPGQPSELMAGAANALERGLRSEPYALRFRGTLYNWAKQSHLGDSRRTVIAKVCADVLAPSRPNEALVRLHHLARREDVAGKRVAFETLRGQVDGDSGQRRRLLRRLARASAEYRDADLRLFLDFSDPYVIGSDDGLIGRADVRLDLRTCWRTVLLDEPRELWLGPLHQWLGACAAGHRPELLLDLLVRAVSDRQDSIEELYTVARAWSCASVEEREQRRTTVSLLLDTIDVVQDREMEPTG